MTNSVRPAGMPLDLLEESLRRRDPKFTEHFLRAQRLKKQIHLHKGTSTAPTRRLKETLAYSVYAALALTLFLTNVLPLGWVISGLLVSSGLTYSYMRLSFNATFGKAVGTIMATLSSLMCVVALWPTSPALAIVLGLFSLATNLAIFLVDTVVMLNKVRHFFEPKTVTQKTKQPLTKKARHLHRAKSGYTVIRYLIASVLILAAATMLTMGMWHSLYALNTAGALSVLSHTYTVVPLVSVCFVANIAFMGVGILGAIKLFESMVQHVVLGKPYTRLDGSTYKKRSHIALAFFFGITHKDRKQAHVRRIYLRKMALSFLKIAVVGTLAYFSQQPLIMTMQSYTLSMSGVASLLLPVLSYVVMFAVIARIMIVLQKALLLLRNLDAKADQQGGFLTMLKSQWRRFKNNKRRAGGLWSLVSLTVTRRLFTQEAADFVYAKHWRSQFIGKTAHDGSPVHWTEYWALVGGEQTFSEFWSKDGKEGPAYAELFSKSSGQPTWLALWQVKWSQLGWRQKLSRYVRVLASSMVKGAPGIAFAFANGSANGALASGPAGEAANGFSSTTFGVKAMASMGAMTADGRSLNAATPYGSAPWVLTPEEVATGRVAGSCRSHDAPDTEPQVGPAAVSVPIEEQQGQVEEFCATPPPGSPRSADQSPNRYSDASSVAYRLPPSKPPCAVPPPAIVAPPISSEDEQPDEGEETPPALRQAREVIQAFNPGMDKNTADMTLVLAAHLWKRRTAMGLPAASDTPPGPLPTRAPTLMPQSSVGASSCGSMERLSFDTRPLGIT